MPRRPKSAGWREHPRYPNPLITCEPGRRRVTRTEYDGQISVPVDQWEGKPLNSPNDVVVKSDGSIWFTDPPFGILGNYEGRKAISEISQAVYRIDGDGCSDGDEITAVTDDVLDPNGLCFSPDESILYVVESRGEPNRKILAFDVGAGGRTIANKRLHNAAPMSASAAPGETACSWRPANPCMRYA